MILRATLLTAGPTALTEAAMESSQPLSDAEDSNEEDKAQTGEKLVQWWAMRRPLLNLFVTFQALRLTLPRRRRRCRRQLLRLRLSPRRSRPLRAASLRRSCTLEGRDDTLLTWDPPAPRKQI